MLVVQLEACQLAAMAAGPTAICLLRPPLLSPLPTLVPPDASAPVGVAPIFELALSRFAGDATPFSRCAGTYTRSIPLAAPARSPTGDAHDFNVDAGSALALAIVAWSAPNAAALPGFAGGISGAEAVVAVDVAFEAVLDAAAECPAPFSAPGADSILPFP